MSLDLYPPGVFDSDKSGIDPSSVDDICSSIHDATKGFGTNEKKRDLLHAMGSQTPAIRCLVHQRFQQLYDKKLTNVIVSECGKKPFGVTLKYLSTSPDIAECYMIHDSCNGLGTNEVLLMTIVCGRSNKEMEHLKKCYFDLYTKDMSGVITGEIKRDFESLIVNCLQASEDEYDTSIYNDEKMSDDIETLYTMGQGKILGTNEKGIFKILCSSPPEYMKLLNLAYADKHGVTLLHMIQSELNGYSQMAAEFIIGMKIKPYEEIAKLIAKASKGFGTNETLLSATLIRYQLLLKDVLLAHIELYGTTIADRIKAETGRDYEALLLEILGAVDAA